MAAVNRQSVFNFLVLSGLVLLLFRFVSLSERGLGQAFGWNARLFDDQVVTQVDAGSPAQQAGLKAGDRIIAFDDLGGFERVEQRERLILAYRRVDVGDSYRLQVLREGNCIDLIIPSQYKGQADTRSNIIQYHVIGLIYLLFGFSILLLKPYDSQAMTFSAFMMSLSACYIPVISSRLPLGIGAAVDIIQYCFVFATPYLFTNFVLSFPDRLLPERVYKWILYLLYALLVAQAVAYLTPKLIDLHSPVTYNSSPQLQWLAKTSFSVFYMAFLAGVLVALVSMLLHLRLSSSTQHKRKVRLVLIGMLIGLPPIIVLNGIARYLGINVVSTTAWIVGLLSLSFPLAFGYAIVKHRVMDVRLILRRSVKYILISRLVSAVETVVVVIFLYYLIVPTVENFTGKIGTNTILISVVACYSLLSMFINFINVRLMRILDALFFRDVYSAEKILTDLAQALGAINEQSELLKIVAGELIRALHVERVAFFLPEQKRWAGSGPNKNGNGNGNSGAQFSNINAAYWLASPLNGSIELQFRSGENQAGFTRLFELVNKEDASVEINYEDRNSVVYQLQEDERKLLEEVQASVLIPLKEGARMVGMMSLGAKLSELPYTSDDIRLLETVAAQISIAIERVWLLREVAQQERLRREMEIASMVQRKLFPEPMSDTPALEIVGICHPARSVGGDYYDFIRISPDKLGIAIGDVSGKGISAALIMSTLQASLRSMASVAQYDVVDVVNIVNNLLCRSTDADKFATFFYGVYDESTNLLTYVNAGHDPPFLLHRLSKHNSDIESRAEWSDVEIKRPDRGGMVLGVLDGYDYEQATIKLDQGDTLIGYTDGLTEAINPKGEFYGEDRIKDLVGQNSHMPARALHQLILDNVRQFMGEADQRDDLTVIVAKVR